MKFTEKQFKQLVKIQAKYFPLTMLEQGVGGKNPYDAIHETDIKLSDFIWNEKLGNEAVALMNPATRDLAYKKYVEQEKYYTWTSKKPIVGVQYRRLYRSSDGVIASGLITKDKFDERAKNSDEHLTVAEIREYGYDPDWFNAVEVK